MENCIFCKIINKDIPSRFVYEDSDVIAILDISQVTLGHTLVIPKKHISDFAACDDETQTKLSIVAKKIANAMLKLDGCVGVNILSNCKEGAGQTVMHYHIHLIPRYVNDGVELNPQPKQKYTNEQLDNLIKSLDL